MKTRMAIGVTWVLAGALCGCNAHPVELFAQTGAVEYQQQTSVDPREELDLLWVIDNSGSMCQEQKILRDNFDRFIEELDETRLDFHIGVTTTHMEEDNRLEPVARPGRLQSTPQPLPGFDRTCWTATDENGANIEGDYQPIRDLLDAAVACMKDPDPTFADLTDAEIACALLEGEECAIPGRCEAGRCTSASIFPSPDTLRELPTVLRSEDYRVDGKLDSERLKADFGCMAMVGMRGYGFEKGLAAALTAVSPRMTGGAVDAPDADPSAPNHGLIRRDARFGLVFVTDENDCSHDGTLTERAGYCGDDSCDFWNHPDVEDSPLLDPATVRDELLENLATTKGDKQFGSDDVLVASIHGSPRRYSGDIIPGEECRVSSPDDTLPAACGAMSACTAPSYQEVPPTCATKLGVAYSGDRYDRFLATFERSFPPSEEKTGVPPTGWMCTGDFRPALAAIGEFFDTIHSGCLSEPIVECGGPDARCPTYRYGNGEGTCRPRPNADDQYFCDSVVQVRARPPNGDALARLRQTGYCYPDSIDPSNLEQGCVVDRTHYELQPCSGGVAGIRVSWRDQEAARNALSGVDLVVRYPSAASTF